uniref:Retrotransposon protein n=1 Tax=Oryza sativa subsp. japonica TaxID=39947 RepID=Q7Y165_ORYSJ|nr:putative retrotransposon protein [Oryza sativa Japonica Group]
MAENQGIEQVMGKLVDMLAKKFSEASTTSNAIIPHTESILKIELMQNEIKLEGVKNYLSWSRRALLILKTKGLEGYVTGEVKEPENTSSVEWKTWSTTNSLVVAWLLTSLIPAIATTVETISSASEMWKTLTKLYSGEGNVMLMVEAQEKISALRQGERSVAEYVAELKSLWSDLDHYDPLGLEHSDCIAKMKKWVERRRVIEFLKGLNPEFEGRRDAMFHQTTLPTLDEAIAAMAQEELKKKVLPSAAPCSPSPTYAIVQGKETRECFNCGEMGHLMRDCHAPRKPTYGRGRGVDRGGTRGGRGYAGRSNRGRGYGYRGDYKANAVTLEEGSSGTTPDNVANFAHSTSGSFNQAFMSMNTSHSSWILDSGASRHVTGMSGEFTSYKPYSFAHKETIQTADGTSCQERRTGKKLGIGIRRDGLWYLDRRGTNEDVCALMASTSKEVTEFIRTDNGGEYMNSEFGHFLSLEGILHQTSCPDTPPQNGVAERKNRHLLEIARSLMYTMNVPKFLWSEAVMTAAYLINRTPSRILGMKTPYEMIFGKNEFVVPPRVFGCTCFVRDHRPSIGKLDPRAVKCIFIGYSSSQKGYKCWSPSERRTFVSMDVTFRESVPFYGEKTDISSLFVDLDDLTRGDHDQQKEGEILGLKENEQSKGKIVVGEIPCAIGDPVQEQEWRKPHEEENLQVYTRRMRLPTTQQVEVDDQVSDDLTHVQVSSESGGEQIEIREEESNLPIAIRKGMRSNAGKPPQRYGFEIGDESGDENDIANYVSYTSLSSTYKAFVASLNSAIIPKDWKEAKQDPRWHQAMLDELEALEKNKTWDLVSYPNGKKVVNCKWVYAVKQNPDGKVERYKARLLTLIGHYINWMSRMLFYMAIFKRRYIWKFHLDLLLCKLKITRLKQNLSKEFEVKDLGQLKYFLGIEIARSPRGIVLSQRKYALDLLSDTESGNPVNKERYQRLVGRLIYLCHTRPDITYAVSMVSRYMHDPRSGHMDAVYRILRYLKGSPGKGLWFKKNGHLEVEGYCDADWASCPDDRRSTSGYCVFVGGNLVSWRSKKQPVVSRSTAEAEYRAMSVSLSELLWLRNLLSELMLPVDTPMKLWCDNKSAISIANNPVQHDRTKHVELDRFFIKEKLDEGVLELEFVMSGGQVADCFTKGLGVKECNSSCDKMGMIDIYHPS